MSSYNRVILMGNLTRDPDLKYTPKGTAIVEIGLALNRVWKTDGGEKREEVTFVDVTFYGRNAEIIGEYCQKGDPLHVEGRLSLDQWEDKQTGQRRAKMKVIGEALQLLGQRREGGNSRPDPKTSSRPPSGSRTNHPAPPQRQKPEPEPAFDPDADDIPF
jgi:single-strand DNA-binding protein